MPEGRRIGLDNSALRGRVRVRDRSVYLHARGTRVGLSGAMDGFITPHQNTSRPNVHKQARGEPRQQQIRTVTAPLDFGPKTPPALPRQSRSVVLARHTVQTKSKKKSAYTKRRSRLSVLLVCMAVLIFVGGVAISYIGWRTNKKAAAQVAVLAKSTNEDSDVPVEDTITDDVLANYSVAPDLPRIIKIPRLQVNARVKRLGVKLTGELQSPQNVNDAGWYDGSSKPGDNGAVLIDGHVHGPTKPGVFYRLGNLKEGDTIQIERGDGKVISYKVESLDSVDQDKVDMAKALVSASPDKPGLNLITCTGRYDVRTNKYEQRLIVHAIQQ